MGILGRAGWVGGDQDTKGACWGSLCVTKDHGEVGTASLWLQTPVGPELFPNFALGTLKWSECAGKGWLGCLTPALGVGTGLLEPPAPRQGHPTAADTVYVELERDVTAEGPH